MEVVRAEGVQLRFDLVDPDQGFVGTMKNNKSDA